MPALVQAQRPRRHWNSQSQIWDWLLLLKKTVAMSNRSSGVRKTVAKRCFIKIFFWKKFAKFTEKYLRWFLCRWFIQLKSCMPGILWSKIVQYSLVFHDCTLSWQFITKDFDEKECNYTYKSSHESISE